MSLQRELPLVEMWRKFCYLKTRFLETYAVYHYFRSLGWVVRDGLIYGSDFCKFYFILTLNTYINIAFLIF